MSRNQRIALFLVVTVLFVLVVVALNKVLMRPIIADAYGKGWFGHVIFSLWGGTSGWMASQLAARVTNLRDRNY